MARTSKVVRRLTAIELGIAIHSGNLPKDALLEAVTGRKHVPKQFDAPVITEIADHRLIMMPGRTIERTAPIAGMSQYLAGQFKLVVSDLDGNTDKRTVAAFREAELLLQDWSIAKLLAFGSHLYLLESYVSPLKQELLGPSAQQVEAVVYNSRRFINNFEEWHEYVKQSVLLDIEVGDGGQEITSATIGTAESLVQEHESVDPQIPSVLNEYAVSANRKLSVQGTAVSVMSALRSITNIAISFTEYVTKAAKTGYALVMKDNRALRLFKAICRFLPHAMRLAAARPDSAWLLNYSDEFRIACETARKIGKPQ